MYQRRSSPWRSTVASLALSMQLASENGHDTTSNPPALSQWHGVSDISRLQAGEPRTKHDSVRIGNVTSNNSNITEMLLRKVRNERCW